MTIQLLVSVRNAEEAKDAVEGGVDIVDVKEPHHGSLGFAGSDILKHVVDEVEGRVPVSAALGECVDWLSGSAGNTMHSPSLPKGLAYTKLGLASLLDRSEPWEKGWKTASNLFAGSSLVPSRQAVAVAYADSQLARSPPLTEVLAAAIRTNCSVFLIDTWRKDDRTTIDWLTTTELQDIRQAAQTANIRFAVAGRLNESHLSQIRELSPDIVGVRGAVCDGSDRTDRLCAKRVAAFRAALQA